MTAPTIPAPLEIKLKTKSRLLELTFADGRRFELPFEYLRVHSPSAEVRGHGHGQGMLVLGKENVGIRAIEPVGQYAVRLVFDDGHDTGLYSWKYLYELGHEQASKWAEYQARVRAFQAAPPPAPRPSGPLAHPPRPLRRHEPEGVHGTQSPPGSKGPQGSRGPQSSQGAQGSQRPQGSQEPHEPGRSS